MKAPKVPLKSRKVLQFTDEQLTAIAAEVGLTLEQLKICGGVAYRVYQEIAADLHCVEGGGTMDRYTVVEVSLDAGRPQEMLRRGEAKYIKGADDPAILEWFEKKASLYDLDKVYGAIAAVSFQYSRYE